MPTDSKPEFVPIVLSRDQALATAAAVMTMLEAARINPERGSQDDFLSQLQGSLEEFANKLDSVALVAAVSIFGKDSS